MALRVAMIGYGAVGSIHAAKLAKEPGIDLCVVYGPKPEKASTFASAHGIKYTSPVVADACSRAEVAIVCSPSTVHFQQSRECLQAGLHTLVELPPCEKSSAGGRTGRPGAPARRPVGMCSHQPLADPVRVARSMYPEGNFG